MAGSRNSSPPDPLLAAVRAALARLALRSSRVAVGLSGGRDSVALLHALARLRGELAIDLSAIHVHHGLSPNADRWAAFCAELCDSLAILLRCARVSVDRASGLGLEAAARAARYAAYAALDVDWIALAHHRGDQAQTVLHNLLRGAGLRGLSGMAEERAIAPAGGPRLVRPLLEVPRALIEDYLSRHRLAWVDDESNFDRSYTRNRLRAEFMPVLAAQFPAIESALARTAKHAAEAEALLEALARIDLASSSPTGRVRLSALRQLEPARARNLLRLVLREAGETMPDAAWLAELQRQLGEIGRDTHFAFELAHGELRCFAGELYVLRKPTGPEAAWNGDLRIPWAGEPHLDWPGGQVIFEKSIGCGFSADRISRGECRLAARRGGESIQPDARRPRRSLKHWYQGLGVPPWERERLPVLWCDGAVVWVPGVGIDMEFACSPGEAGWLPSWISCA